MKKSTSTVLAAALLIGAAASAQSPIPRKPFGTGELPEFLKAYDVDGDGKLSAEERLAFEQAIRESRPKRPDVKNPWDTDGDGTVSPEEQQAARDAIAAKMAEARTKHFNELDADQDGFLSAEELKAIPRITPEAITRMIDHLDTDKDGQISLDEFTAVLKPVAPPVPPFPLPQPLPKPLPPRGIAAPFVLAAFDTDKNGLLSAEEVANMITTIDTSADGKVSPEEWRAWVAANKPTAPPLPPVPPMPGPGPEAPNQGTTSGR